jgi:hypothetical protein
MSLIVIWALSAGCEPGGPLSRISAGSGNVFNDYAASKVRIVGLSEFTNASQKERRSTLNVYVDLLDSFDNRIKSPGVFRFELYRFEPRSSQPKGKRIFIWPDIDLKDADLNNSYWQDFLRSYRFDLDLNFAPRPNDSFIVEATFTTPRGRRLRDTFQLRHEGR